MRYLIAPQRALAVMVMLLLQTGCSILAVADAGVSAVATTVKVGAKAVSTVVDAVVPDKDKENKK
jgi:hypothetical protein